MWFLVDNNEIVEGPVVLQNTWVKGDTQYPLKEMGKKDHIDDLRSLGWLKEYIVEPDLDDAIQKVVSYTHKISFSETLGSFVKTEAVILNKNPSELQEYLDKEIIRKRGLLRRDIASKVGDTPSILGTVSDATQILTLISSIFVTSLDSSTSYTGFKSSIISQLDSVFAGGSTEIIANAQEFLTKVGDGTIALPYDSKDGGSVTAVFDEIEAVVDGVAKEIISHKPV